LSLGRVLPSVLAITRDRAFLRALRVDMPLVNLKRQGFIDRYFITDPSLFDLPSEFSFDVLWLQRVTNRSLIDLLADRIDSQYLYDLDDLLIGPAPCIQQGTFNSRVVLDSIGSCRVLTVTSWRLLSILERIAGLSLANKAFVCPNAFEFGDGVRTPMKPRGIILTSSESMFPTDSVSSILSEVESFSRRHDLPVFHFGPAHDPAVARFLNRVSFGRVSFWHYHAILGSLPPMIGVAPLPTDGCKQTLDFVNGKSDVKMMEYGGFGHPSVYSDALPYVESDLEAGITVTNTRESWADGLHRVYTEHWKRLNVEQRRVMDLRRMDRVAAERWSAAIDRARLTRCITGRDLGLGGGKLRFLSNAVKHMVLSQDHVFLKRLEEQVPLSVMKFLRRFVVDS
jgi:hypothetical protein